MLGSWHFDIISAFIYLSKLFSSGIKLKETLDIGAVHAFFAFPRTGYKRGKSRADLKWAQRMLVSVVSSKHWTYYKMGLHKSKAYLFKCNLLYDAGFSYVDVKLYIYILVQYLLSNTKLRVPVTNSLQSGVFEVFEILGNCV